MKSWTLAVALGLFGAQVGVDEDEVDGIFSEPDRDLELGRWFLDQGRAEDAIEAFRQAESDSDDAAAAVQFNVARALEEDARRALKDAKKDPQPGQPPQLDPEVKDRMRKAAEAFERAGEMSRSETLKSQSAQAAGNAWVRGEELPRAVEQYRRSLVADPQNEGSRRNLARALRMMRAEPPPPPQPSESDEKEEEEEKDQEQKDQEQQQQEQQQQEQKDDEEKKEEEQQKPQEQPKDDEEKQEPKPKPSDDEQPPEPEKKPESSTKKEREREKARQILDSMRSRERPLDPQLMRDRQDPPPRSGKDW